MPNSKDKITIDEAEEALLRSGYLLEHRVATILQTEGYYVQPNAPFVDKYTGKSREIDLSALTAEPAGPNRLDYIFSKLTIECINNSQPIGFITREPQEYYTLKTDIKFTGVPAFVPADGESSAPLSDYLGFDKFHHHCKGRIATQFFSFTKKNKTKEWMASHEDAHFNAFENLCIAVSQEMDQHVSNWNFEPEEPVNLQFYNQILVVQGDLLDVKYDRSSLQLSKTKHVHFIRSEISNNEEHSFHIDVVTENYFPQLIRTINGELSRIGRLMRRRHDAIRKAINVIIEDASDAEPNEIREILNF